MIAKETLHLGQEVLYGGSVMSVDALTQTFVGLVGQDGGYVVTEYGDIDALGA